MITLTIGTPNDQKISMVVDMSTPNTYMTTTECTLCKYDKFDVMKSKSSHYTDPNK